MGQFYIGGESLSSEITKDTKPVPLRNVLPGMIVALLMLIALSTWAYSLLTDQRLVSLDNSSDGVVGNGRWATLSADSYTVTEYIGKETMEFTESRKHGSSKTYYRDMYIYRIKVNGVEPYSMYVMVTGNTAVKYQAGETVDLSGQCRSLRETTPSFGVVSFYLQDSDEPSSQYWFLVAFTIGMSVLIVWMLWSVPRAVKKRNAEIAAWRKKHGYNSF